MTHLYYCNVCSRHTTTPDEYKPTPNYKTLLHCPHCHYAPVQKIDTANNWRNQLAEKWQQKQKKMLEAGL
ncbi:MAG: hypothetical protein FWD52_04660 [Candidatus Bathyarchaeota archaeon]|nr:hypothetical protein [Candidatus Termiticorpusculum sp.]